MLPFSQLQLHDWRPAASDNAGRRFLAWEQTTGWDVEICLLPSTVDFESIQRQIRLLPLLPARSSSLLATDLDSVPGKLVWVAHPHLRECLTEKTPPSLRWDWAGQLLSLTKSMVTVGMRLPSLDVENICCSQDQRLQVNFFSPWLTPSIGKSPVDNRSQEMKEADFAEALQNRLHDLLHPILDVRHSESPLDGMARAQLASLLRSNSATSDLFGLLDRWSSLFNSKESAASPFIPTTTAENTSSTAATITPTSGHSQSSDSETTCEVAVNLVGQETDGAQAPPAYPSSGNPELGNQVPEVGLVLGRFRLERKLGQGGMGVVFQAVDLSDDSQVAVKILQSSGSHIAQSIRRFRKEAKLLGAIQNPHVTRLIDSGYDRGFHFLAMEFVQGTDLKTWLEGQHPISEPTALSIIADVCRALVDAHQADIVHRDIKPENILLAQRPNTTGESWRDYQVKLTDFGIARAIHQSASQEVTRAGSLLGTPTYMSPEQFKGPANLSTAADVYSLGILLYRLLTGAVPFISDDPMKLAAMHCFDAPLDIRRRQVSVSDGTSSLLSRMLAKLPTQRPADAYQILTEVELILRGDSQATDQSAAKPEAGRLGIWSREFTWELNSLSQELWPYVSNTERLNRAAGLHSVDYQTVKDPERGLRRIGSFRLGGIPIQWEEHPFEWIEGRRMAILREFETGPFLWFLSTVELKPLTHGKTQLVHSVQIAPRNRLGKWIAAIEAGWKGGRALDRIYRRIDQSLQFHSENPLHDAFEDTRKAPKKIQARLQQRKQEMIHNGVALDTAETLVSYLQNAAPQALAQLRPLELSDRLSIPAEDMLDACLVAAACGLLQLRWDILCPTCRVAANSVTLLTEIQKHTNCEACDAAFQSDIATAIELVFQAHPEVAEVDSGQYCIGGPEHSPHVVAQLRLQPGQRVEALVPIETGNFLLRTTHHSKAQPLQVRSQGAPSSLEMDISRLGESPNTPAVRTGVLSLRLTNDLAEACTIRLERSTNRSQVVTAATASALPRFRQLFPDQILNRDRAVLTDELTLLAVRISSCDQLYNTLSESDAYQRLQDATTAIEQVVQLLGGATIRSEGETLVASFRLTEKAVAAAWELETLELQKELPPQISMAKAVHRGSLLVTTQNGRLDYFGSTSRQVSALSQTFENGVAITDRVFCDPVTRRQLATYGTEPTVVTVDLPGAPKQLVQVFHQSHSLPV